MSDLISRQAAIEAVEKESQVDGSYGYMDTKSIVDLLEDLPSTEPERKTGKWERHYSRPNVYADLWWHCSVCGYKNDDQYANRYHHYCPNCGSLMEVEHED